LANISIAQDQEQTVISMSVLYPDVLKMLGFLEIKDFIFEPHAKLWGHILQMIKDEQVIDCVSLHTYLRKNEPKWLDEIEWYLDVLYNDTLNFKSLPYLKMAKAIRLRRLERDLAQNPDLEHAKELFQEQDRLSQEKTDHYTMEQALANWLQKYDNNVKGISTGYSILDKHIDRMNAGNLIVLSARPSIGKSTFALNIAYNCANRGDKVLYINLEMNVNDIISKIMGISTAIETNKFRDKELTHYEAKMVMDRSSDLIRKGFPLNIIDVGSITPSAIKRYANEEVGLKLLVIDQLTKIKPEIERGRKDLEIADATLALKELAKELKIPILLVHQTNRNVELKDNKMPTLANLKDSSAVEQDADVVIFLNRKSYYTGNVDDKDLEGKIAKNKMGVCGDLLYQYNRSNSQIIEIPIDRKMAL
jgi:replicative DNA helicase